MLAEVQKSLRPVLVDSSSQDLPDKQMVRRGEHIVETSRVPAADMLLKYGEKARQLDGSVMDDVSAKEHPFLHVIHCSANLLTTSEMKSKIIEVMASQRTLIWQLVKLKAQYASLRAGLQEEEGGDATDAFCKAHYDMGDGYDADSKLATALLELTFQLLSFPGLDIQDSHARQTVECN